MSNKQRSVFYIIALVIMLFITLCLWMTLDIMYPPFKPTELLGLVSGILIFAIIVIGVQWLATPAPNEFIVMDDPKPSFKRATTFLVVLLIIIFVFALRSGLI